MDKSTVFISITGKRRMKMGKLKLSEMIELSKSSDNVFWIEKRDNFVKLCFLFTPEKDEDLNDVDLIYKKINDNIAIDDYNIFSVSEENGKWMATLKTNLVVDGFIQVLVPTKQKINSNTITRLLAEKDCKLSKIYSSFYSLELIGVQNDLEDSLIITHSNLKQCREFSSCPLEIDTYNLAVYSVDIYGKNVENIDWS